MALSIFVEFLAISFVFSDLSPDERITQRVVFSCSIFFLGGTLVGWVAIRRWLVSALCDWSPLGMGILMLVSKFTDQGDGPTWASITVFLVAPLILAIIGGYSGYRFKERLRPQKQTVQRNPKINFTSKKPAQVSDRF